MKGGSIFRDEAEARERAAAFSGDGRVFVGHVPLSFRPLFPTEARFFTLVREPVERTISHYYAQVRPAERRGLPELPPIGLAVGPGRIVPDNLQVRMLCGRDLPLDAPVTPELLTAAKDALERLVVVGTVERFDESVALLAHTFGLRHVLYRSERVFPRPHAGDLSPADLAAVAAANQLDQELHAHAVEVLDRALRDQGAPVQGKLSVLRHARGLLTVADQGGELPAASDELEIAATLEVRELQLYELRSERACLLKENARLSAGLERPRLRRVAERVGLLVGAMRPTR
jgi:hypothetical protein